MVLQRWPTPPDGRSLNAWRMAPGRWASSPARLPVSRPAVSQHLKVLKDAGIVIDHREGNRSIYQVNADGLGALRAYLEPFWKQALAAFSTAAEQPHGGGHMTVQEAANVTVRRNRSSYRRRSSAHSPFTPTRSRSWWSKDHHVLKAELAEMIFEPRVGGHVYDRGVDGSECRWARVLAYEPPRAS